MRPLSVLATALSIALVAVACSSSTSNVDDGSGYPTVPPPDGTSSGAPAPDAASDAGPAADAAPDAKDSGLTGQCASTFGNGLTAGFGRLDGVVYAVQKPTDTKCTFPNNDHVVLQVLANGAVYRMVVNVKSDRAGVSPDVRLATLAHALPAPAFAEGWHNGAALDYVTTLGASSANGFTPTAMDPLVTKLATVLHVGDPVSVYATSDSGRPESAHLVHRNKTNADGAIVLSPQASPSFLLFHFENQTF